MPPPKNSLTDERRIQTKMRMCVRCLGSAATLVLGLILFAHATSAQTQPTATSAPIPHGTVELVAENQWIAPAHDFLLGLRFKLEKGWHIYWDNPGDSGEPPRIDWKLPAGISAKAIEWPTPERLGTSSIVDYGYQDDVMLIVPMHADPNVAQPAPAQFAAQLKVLVCREMCIPGKAQVSLALPIKSQPPPPDHGNSTLFATARQSLPRPAPASWKFKLSEQKDSFTLVGILGRQISNAVFFPLDESRVNNSASQKVVPAATGFAMTLPKSDQLLKPIARLRGVLVLSADRAYTIDVPVSKPAVLKN